MDNNIGKSVTVKGKVQGVFYRASVLFKALDLELTGWVQNHKNGDVILEVFGDKANVAELIVWCNIGSEFSDVKTVEVTDISYKELERFTIKY